MLRPSAKFCVKIKQTCCRFSEMLVSDPAKLRKNIKLSNKQEWVHKDMRIIKIGKLNTFADIDFGLLVDRIAHNINKNTPR